MSIADLAVCQLLADAAGVVVRVVVLRCAYQTSDLAQGRGDARVMLLEVHEAASTLQGVAAQAVRCVIVRLNALCHAVCYKVCILRIDEFVVASVHVAHSF